MLIGFQLRCMFSLYASFTVLGLKSTSRMDEVKRKYYELAKQYHPDVNSADKNAGAKFAEINKVIFALLRLISTSLKISMKKRALLSRRSPKVTTNKITTQLVLNSRTKKSKRQGLNNRTTKIFMTTITSSSRVKSSGSRKQEKTSI
jgi:hypothetical protein